MMMSSWFYERSQRGLCQPSALPRTGGAAVSGTEQGCRDRLHQARGKRQERRNQMYLSHIVLDINMRTNTSSSSSGNTLECTTAKLHIPAGHQALKSRHSSVEAQSLLRNQGQFWAEAQGSSSPLLSSPKLPPLLCARDPCLGRRIIRVATHECTRVLNVQQEVHKLCHTGGRAWSNILKYYCPQDQNR